MDPTKLDQETSKRLLAGLLAIAEGKDDDPLAQSARDFLDEDLEGDQLREQAKKYAVKLAQQLGVDLDEREQQKDAVRARMGLARRGSTVPHWGGPSSPTPTASRRDRVFPALMSKHDARELLERSAKSGSIEAAQFLDSIRRGR